MVFTGGIHGSSGVNNIAGSTACQIPGEKQLEHSSGKNARISSSQSFAADSVSLPRLDTLAGTCPTHRRQWADFLAALTVLPHRQYKTARTETRWHLLLKHGRCQFRHRLCAVMFCSAASIRDTHESPKIVCWLAATVRGVLQTWKDMDHNRCQQRYG